MERQRCVMGAIAQAADPMAMLTKFQSLAAATEKNIKTDIPAGMFPAFAELGLKVKNAKITSLTINRHVVNPGDPDYDHLRQVVEEALTPAPDVDDSIEASTGAGTNDSSEAPQQPDGADGEPTENGDASTYPGSDPTEAPDPEKPVDVTTAC
jgi:anionic cell wall polymer biosynthesis LytR-Cps2A-Psr (LCP) family protein